MSRVEDLHSTKESKFTFQWTVVNIHMFGGLEGKEIVSSKFTVPSLDNTEWYLKLVNNTENTSSAMCFLHRTDKGPESVKISYSLSVGSFYSVEHQTFAKNSSSIMPGILNILESDQKLDQSFSKDVLIECHLWQWDKELFRTRSVPKSPYPVFSSTRTLIPCEQRNFFIPAEISNNNSRVLIASVCVDSAGNSYPKLVCELWKVSFTTMGHKCQFKFLKPDPQPSTPLVVKYRIKSANALKKQRLLFSGRFVLNNDDYELGFCTLEALELERIHKFLFFCEVAFSDNNAVNFFESTRYDSSNIPALNPSWGVYLDHKYNEHRFLFRLLAVFVFIVSLLIPYLFTDTSL